jgi:two-component system, LytTR family, response regulator
MQANSTKIVIVEDEPMSLATLEDMLLDYSDRLQIVGRASTLAQARKVVAETNPDLVFLDIYLPDGDGFELVKHFPNRAFKIIFTTAYDQYALQAFSVAAIHYLLKPIHPDLLHESLERFWQQSEQARPRVSVQPPLAHLAIHSQDDMQLVPVQDILYCEADASYTIFYLKNKQRRIASKPLGVYEKILPTHLFSRLHYKYLVNLGHITRYVKGKGGQVELSNGQLIDVSVRKKQPFLQQLENFLQQKDNPA